MRTLVTIAVVVGVLAAMPAGATVFQVDHLSDASDEAEGDGTCATSLGWCTLRAAVEEASALGGAHQIDVPVGTIVLSAPLYVAGADLTIRAAGQTSTFLDGGNAKQILYVADDATVRLSDATLQDGYDEYGNSGGCVVSEGWLELERVTVTGCSSNGGSGGGIRSGGTLVMSDATLSDNEAPAGGGGGLRTFGLAVLDRVTVTGNSAVTGGGIEVGGPLVLSDSLIGGNSASHSGGGVSISYTSVTTVIERSLIQGNTTDGSGAGLRVRGTNHLRNVTFTGNVASEYGGAIYGWTNGDLHLVNVTISGNQGLLGAGAVYGWEGYINADAVNTLIGDNGSVNCNADLESLGHNLQYLADSCGLAAAGDVVATRLDIFPLDFNGGPTKTLALGTASPALDAGDDSFAAGYDQRGWSAPVDGDGDGTAHVDIGAFEYGGAQTLIFTDGFESGGQHRW